MGPISSHSMKTPLHLLRIRLLALFGLIGTIAAASCSDPVTVSQFQPEITNAADNFQLQATGLTSVTSTLTYTWANSGTRATVNHSTTTTAGTAHLTIRDAGGAVVYDKDLVPSLNEPTVAGTPGNWNIRLQVTNYSGTINFRVQKL